MTKITINFLSGQPYPQLRNSGLEIGNSLGHDLSIKYGKIVTQSSPKIINGLATCVGFGIFTPTKKFLAHSAPEIDNDMQAITNIAARTIYDIREFSKCKDEDVSAVIYGGIAYDAKNPISEQSCQLVDALEESCISEGINPTIVSGQYSDGINTRINSYISKNQITLWGNWINNIRWHNNASLKEIQKILENFFEYVKLNHDVKPKSITSLSPYNKLLIKN